MFWRKKKKKITENPVKEKSATKIAGALLLIQQRFGDFFNKKTEHFSIRNQKVFLISVCVLFGSFSVYTVVISFVGSINRSPFQRPVSIHRPQYLENKDRETSDHSISESEYRRIKRFQEYMDSLQKNNKLKYDTLVAKHPGLMDSVRIILNIYQNQKKE